MKGVIKCYGLFLASVITLGVSFVASSDVNALLYNVDTIPLYSPFAQPSYPNFYQAVPGGMEVYSSEVDFDKLNKQLIISMTDSVNPDATSPCVPVSGARAYAIMPQSWVAGDGTYRSNYSFSGYNEPRPSGRTICNSIKPLFSDSNLITPVANLFPASVRTQVKDILPYRFSYDGFYVTDTYRNEETGIVTSSKFDLMWHLFTYQDISPNGFIKGREKNYPDAIYDVFVPLGSGKQSVVSNYSVGMPVTVEGELILDPYNYGPPIEGDPFEGIEFGLSDSTYVELQQFYGTGSSYTTLPSSCTFTFEPDPLSDYDYPPFSLRYSCSAQVGMNVNGEPQDYGDDAFPWFRLHFHFDYDNENTALQTFLFDSSILFTDNDRTPAGSFNDPVSGNHADEAPGTANTDLPHNVEPDFGASLKELFGFSFINPFAPIFELFSNGSCVNIPTLAGMLHSNETTVCPWFPSEVRAIVTPVLGISSMMLVFGFAVRWLGARSGNFVEDSGGLDSGGYHFENKFRRRAGR